MNLSLFECTIVKRLAENLGEPVRRDELLKALYPNGPKHSPDSNCLEVFIGRIRKEIGRDYIKTVHGTGYMLTRLPPGMQPTPEQLTGESQ